MHTTRLLKIAAVSASAMLLVAACGGSSGSSTGNDLTLFIFNLYSQRFTLTDFPVGPVKIGYLLIKKIN